jgi:hypothetical protein
VFTLAVSTGVEVGEGMEVGNNAVIVVAGVVFNVIGAGVVRAGVVLEVFAGAVVGIEVFIDA